MFTVYSSDAWPRALALCVCIQLGSPPVRLHFSSPLSICIKLQISLFFLPPFLWFSLPPISLSASNSISHSIAASYISHSPHPTPDISIPSALALFVYVRPFLLPSVSFFFLSCISLSPSLSVSICLHGQVCVSPRASSLTWRNGVSLFLRGVGGTLQSG